MREKPTICAGINTYNNRSGLRRVLDSLAEKIDRIFCIDGRYRDFDPHLPSLSTDGTKELVARYPNSCLILLPQSTEIEKRNRYLELAEDYDFCLVIDDDEYVHPELADWDLFKENLRRAPIECPWAQIFDVYFGGSIAESGARPRLFYRPSTIRYWQKHYWFMLVEKQGLLLKGCSDSGHLVKGITVLHDRSVRSEQYNKARKQYGEWLRFHENAVV